MYTCLLEKHACIQNTSIIYILFPLMQLVIAIFKFAGKIFNSAIFFPRWASRETIILIRKHIFLETMIPGLPKVCPGFYLVVIIACALKALFLAYCSCRRDKFQLNAHFTSRGKVTVMDNSFKIFVSWE